MPLEGDEQRLAQARLQQPVAEPADGAVVGRRILQRQPDKAAKRHPVVQRFLQPMVRQRIDTLQHQRLDHQQRIKGRATAPLGTQPRQQRPQIGPVHFPRQPLQPDIATQTRRHQAIHQATLIHRKRPPTRDNESPAQVFCNDPLAGEEWVYPQRAAKAAASQPSRLIAASR